MTAPARLSFAMAVLAVGVLGVAGCGGKQRGPAQAGDDDFECRNRRVAYIVENSFAGPEVGVFVDCAERGPRIKKWIVADREGNRTDSEHSLGTAEFDELWQKIESTGWRNLGDCDAPEAKEGETSYKFGIQDQVLTVTLSCAGQELPFPYNRLVNELDLKVAEYGL